MTEFSQWECCLDPCISASIAAAVEWLHLSNWRCFCLWTHGNVLLGDREMISITLAPSHWFPSSLSDFEPMHSSSAALPCSLTLRTHPAPTVDSADLLAIKLIRTPSTCCAFPHQALPVFISLHPCLYQNTLVLLI